MKMDLRSPCAQCPFRRDIPPFLHRERAREITGDLIDRDTAFSWARWPNHIIPWETMDTERRETTVAGTRVTLEKRACAGGCRKTFWCLPSSPATTARAHCAIVCATGMTNSMTWMNRERRM